MRTLLLFILLLTGVLWFWGLRRASILFTLVIRDGRIARSSGKIPPRLLFEVGEIVDRAGVTQARIRGVLRDGHPVLLFEGEMDPGTQQQMRNVVGQFSAAEIRSGKRR